jgi:hypothetical protein
MPDHQVISLAGRPFPLFIQTYLGALKSWMLLPTFSFFGANVALPNAPGETTAKLKTMLSMYDGSHFYRLMNVGGVFERMYEGSSGPKAAIGIAVILACVAFCVLVYRRKIARARAVTFLIVTALLVTLGVFLLPDAVRIHHAVLVYPLPHLIIAA